MQSSRADARQPSRASSPANNGTSPGRLLPPPRRANAEGRVKPPLLRPSATVEAGHPVPVNGRCLGNGCQISHRCIARDPESVSHPCWPANGGRGAADANFLAATGLPALAAKILNFWATGRCRLELEEGWERLGPPVEISSCLEAAEPDVFRSRLYPKTEFYEVGVLVHNWDLSD